MSKRTLFYWGGPLTWFAERWFILSIVYVSSKVMFSLGDLVGILTSVFGLIYFIHRYIAWDLIEEYFDNVK